MNSPSPFSNLALRKRVKLHTPHFEALLEMLPYPALLIDASYERTLLANTQAVELTAYSRAELKGFTLKELLPGIDKSSISANYQAPFQTTALLRGGKSLDVQATLAPLDDQHQWSLLILESLTAISQRNAEIQRQSSMLDSLHNLFLSFQEPDSSNALEMALAAGRILAGATFMAIYSAEQDDFTLNCSAVSGSSDLLPAKVTPNDLVALQSPYFWSRKKRAISNLHREARVSNLAFVVTAPLGQPNALIGLLVAAGEQEPDAEEVLAFMQILATGITGIIQSHVLTTYLQKSLQSKSTEVAFGAAIKEASQEAIVTLSPDLTIQELNPSAESILGYASREVQGRPYQHILVGADNLIPTSVSDQSRVSLHNLGNVHLYRRDGHPFLANVRTLPLVVNEQLESVIILIQDLSQEEQYRLHNQQLEQRALIGEVSAILAHEFRNPINNISTGLELMGMNLPEDDRNQEVITRLQNDCDRLEELMKSTLAFVRPMDYNLVPVDLGLVMPKLLDRWLPHLARVNISHSVQIDSNTPPILGDVRALEQVWNNLIANAIQAMGREGGSLVVKVRPVISQEQIPHVEVSITDTGPGIPEDIKEKVFEPFFTTNRGGTGLGLPLAKRIVSAHRGTIKVTTFPGGTSFQVHIPVATTT
jgi:two-component system, NtrC family, sensor histidine kinase AtoS